jgi:hypothetical protein
LPEHEHQAPDAVEKSARPAPAESSAPAEMPAAGGSAWLAEGLGHSTAGAPRAAFIADAQRTHGNAWVARAVAQRQAADGEPAAAGKGDRKERAPDLLIVDDDAAVEPGQMGRRAFVDALRAAATETASATLDGTMWAFAVDSGVREWLAPYEGADAHALEQAIKAKAPGAAGAGSAAALISAVRAAVRRALEERLAQEEQEGKAGEGPKDDAAAAAPDVLAQLPGARMAAEVAQILFKRRADAPSGSADPRAILRRLGPGRPLDGGVRARMEPLLGGGLGEVRVHADSRAADASAQLGASAFTTGRHVAFAAGEYAPGTPVGDALLAHELAHVAQQGPGGALPSSDERALEDDADASAETAVAALYGGERRVQRRPRLRDGLALRRCTPEKKKEKPPPAPQPGPAPKATDEPMPANPKAVYDAKLPEAVSKLQVAFGRAEGTGRFHKQFWEVKSAKGDEYLELKEGVAPSVAIDAMFGDLKSWSLDCAQFVQVAHLYALRWALGSTKFNERVGGVRFAFRAHDSTLLNQNVYWNRTGPGGAIRKYQAGDDRIETQTMEQLVEKAPLGSRVMWTNQMAIAGAAFEHENTLKLANDSFAAQGFSDKSIFTREELEQHLAEAAVPKSTPAEERAAKATSFRKSIFIQQVEIFHTGQELPSGGGP